MPLPFLTADRASGVPEYAADPAARLEDPGYWRRPYRPGPWRVAGAALVLLLASYVLISTMIIAFAGALTSAAVCAGAAALVIAFALRLLRVGVWVSAQGLRHVALFRTMTLTWPEVATVRTAQQPVRWLGLPRTVQGEALLLFPAAGSSRRPGAAAGAQPSGATPPRILLTDHNADFLARPDAFDKAADVIEAWTAEAHGA